MVVFVEERGLREIPTFPPPPPPPPPPPLFSSSFSSSSSSSSSSPSSPSSSGLTRLKIILDSVTYLK
nr:unnamed protein product [Spirometra erinaceieuropaei]